MKTNNYVVAKTITNAALGVTLALTPAGAYSAPPKAKSSVTLPADAIEAQKEAARKAGEATGKAVGKVEGYDAGVIKGKELCPKRPVTTPTPEPIVPKPVRRSHRGPARTMDGCQEVVNALYKGTSKEGTALGKCMTPDERNNLDDQGWTISKGMKNSEYLKRGFKVRGARVDNRRWKGCARKTLCHVIHQPTQPTNNNSGQAVSTPIVQRPQDNKPVGLPNPATAVDLPGRATAVELPSNVTPSLEDKMSADLYVAGIALTNGTNHSVGTEAGVIFNLKKYFTVGLGAGYRFFAGPKSMSVDHKYVETTPLFLGDKVVTNEDTYTDKQGAHVFTAAVTGGLRYAFDKVSLFLRGGPLVAYSEQGSGTSRTNQKVVHPNGFVDGDKPETHPVQTEYTSRLGLVAETGIKIPFRNGKNHVEVGVRCEKVPYNNGGNDTSCGLKVSVGGKL